MMVYKGCSPDSAQGNGRAPVGAGRGRGAGWDAARAGSGPGRLGRKSVGAAPATCLNNRKVLYRLIDPAIPLVILSLFFRLRTAKPRLQPHIGLMSPAALPAGTGIRRRFLRGHLEGSRTSWDVVFQQHQGPPEFRLGPFSPLPGTAEAWATMVETFRR